MGQSKIKKGIIYVFAANVISLLISLFTGFVLPKYLSIETYASVKLFQLYITYIGIMHLGFADGMYLRLGGKDLEKLDKTEVKTEFKTYKIFQLVVTIISIIVAIIIKNGMLLFCAIVIFPINIGNYLRNFYNAVGLFDKYSKFTNINTLIIFIINLILIFLVKTDYYIFYIFAYIVAYFVYWIFIELETKKLLGNTEKKVKADKKYLIEDIKSGFSLLIGNFSNVIFTSIDRLFVQYLLGSVQFAYYSFAVSIENLMTVFVTPISTVMYNYFCNHKEKEQILNVKKYILLFSATIIAVIFPAKFVVNMWIEKYEEALTVMFLLFAAQYISIMIRCVHINLYKATKKQNRYFVIMIIVVVASVIANAIAYVLFESITAIAIATLIINTLWFIIGEIDLRKYKLQIKDYIYIFAVLAVFLICGCVFNAVIGLLVYVIAVIIISLIFEKDVVFKAYNEAKNFVKNRLVKKPKN